MERGERILPPSPLCFHHAGQPQRPPSHFRLSLLLLSEHGTFSESQSYYPSPASWRGDKSSPAPWKRGSAEPLFLAPAVGLAMTITLYSASGIISSVTSILGEICVNVCWRTMNQLLRGFHIACVYICIIIETNQAANSLQWKEGSVWTTKTSDECSWSSALLFRCHGNGTFNTNVIIYWGLGKKIRCDVIRNRKVNNWLF